MRTATALVVMLLIFAIPAGADVPWRISYQATLVDEATGVPLEGPRELTFTLFGLSGEIWQETLQVAVVHGVVDTVLGAVSPLDVLAFDEPYLLGVSVDGGPPLLPLVELTGAPYAFRAAIADSILGDGDTDWTIAAGDVYRLDGNVGIGTSEPAEKLTVVGDVRIDGNLAVSGGLAGGLRHYDSGWFSIESNTTYTLDHALGTDLFLPVVWFKDAAGNVSGPRGGIAGFEYDGAPYRGMPLLEPTPTHVSLRTYNLGNSVVRMVGDTTTAVEARVILVAIQ